MHFAHKVSLALAFLPLMGMAIIHPAQAQILNGSFETGTFVNNGNGGDSLATGSTAITGWTTTNAELAWLVNGNPYSVSTPYGSYFLDLTGFHDASPYGGVTQTIATTTGASYHLSFSLGSFQNTTTTYGGAVSATASAGTTSQNFTFTPATGTTASPWGTFGLDFIATASSTPITIIGITAAQGAFIGLDNVSVTPNVPAVPEASTTVSFGLLLALGLGGVVIAAKRRKTSAP